MVNVKGLLFTILISIIIVVLLMYFVYDFDMGLVYISNVFFSVGVVFFFLGLIIVTGATDMFSGVGYISRKTFFKDRDDGNDFKSFYDYKEYKKNRKDRDRNYKAEIKGLNILLVGGIYIVVSIAISRIA